MAMQVILDAKLDSAAAESLARKLADTMDQDIVVDASAVELLGGLCLETLLSARHLWAAAGLAFRIENPSGQMIENLRRFGLEPDEFLGGSA